MKLGTCLLLFITERVAAFSLTRRQLHVSAASPLYALKEPETKEDTQEDDTSPANDGELPWWWDAVWKLGIMEKGEPGTDIIFGDSANVIRTNIEQIFGNYPSLDGCPLAEGEFSDVGDGTMFIGLYQYNAKYGSPYKLCFGPKSFP